MAPALTRITSLRGVVTNHTSVYPILRHNLICATRDTHTAFLNCPFRNWWSGILDRYHQELEGTTSNVLSTRDDFLEIPTNCHPSRSSCQPWRNMIEIWEQSSWRFDHRLNAWMENKYSSDRRVHTAKFATARRNTLTLKCASGRQIYYHRGG